MQSVTRRRAELRPHADASHHQERGVTEVLVVLEVVDGEHAASLLDKECILVDAVVVLLVGLAHLQDVLEPVERDLDNLVVRRLEQVAQGLDAPLRHEVPDLTRLLQSSRRRVRQGPAGLLLGLEVGVLQDVEQGRDDVGVDDGLDLLRTAAVMLLTVQHASLRMPSLGDDRRARSAGRAPDARTTWV